jgi:hypothetical protein
VRWREFDAGPTDWCHVPREPPRVSTGADFDAEVVDAVGVDLDEHR